MQKNLKSKVLLTLLAASVFYLPAYANAAEFKIDGDTVTATDSNLNDWENGDKIYYTKSLQNNTITINNTQYSNTISIYGAYGSSRNTDNQTETLNSNTITVKGSTFSNSTYIYGAYAYWPSNTNSTATLTGNSVTINGNTTFNQLAEIYGAYMASTYSKNITATFEENSVKIDNGVKFKGNAYIYGAYANMGSANKSSANFTGNTVTISGADFGNIADIRAADAQMASVQNSTAAFEENSVKITDGTFRGDTTIYGAYANMYNATNSSATFTNNNVTISGGTFEKSTNIYGAYASLYVQDLQATDGPKAEFTNNTVTLTGNAGGDLKNVNLYGYGYVTTTANENPVTGHSNNNLIVDDWNGTVGSAHNFDNINFVNTEWKPNATVLTIAGAAENDLAKTKIDIVSFASGAEFKPGESMTFIKGNANLGIAKEQNDAAETAEYINAGVAQVVNGTTTITDNGTAFKFTVDSVGLAQQTYLVAETRAASAAFVNQGTDLINDSLDVLGRDGSYGVKTFAAVQGNRSTYSVADDLKINGWSVIAGFGAENAHKGGDFAWGVFYENGSGNYRTYNTFNNEFFRGDGSMVYNGGGIAARYENAKGVYTEGSLRAGMLKTEMDNALRDSAGSSYGYDSESTYYGAHVGVGQIFELSENTDLDVYGKFFHTYVEGDSFTVGSDVFDFDSVTSDRLRVGARVTKQQAKVNTYYGLAYEYEFNGDADMTAQGIRAERQSFGGGSGIAELGFNYQPGNDSPWNFDLNLRGYVGERQGGSFNVQATYTF